MLEHLNHPFLCNLRYSFQDVEYLYIVVDLMTGGDLRFHISRKTFTEDALRFWMAELGCALRYIHGQGIVHRDVKPDNVLLDSQGHVHLADFNVASDFRPPKLLHSRSGTLAYLAPEVFDGSGYLSEVDWWSLGVTFYECLYNKRPFEAKGHEALAAAIKAAQPRFYVTQPPVSLPCLHAISSLLERDRRKRIGAAGFDTFTSNPFFQPIDFAALERKQIPPVFVPSTEKTNFDATYDLEELLLEEAPLEARARRQKPRAELKEDATDKEIREDGLYRMIETLFEPFDYTTSNYEGTAAAALAGQNVEENVELTTSASSHLSQPQSSAPSVSGSPPLQTEYLTTQSATDDAEQGPNSNNAKETPKIEVSPKSHGTSFSRPILPKRHSGASRKISRSGGIQVVLDAAGSWSGLSDQNATLPVDSLEGVGAREGKGGPSGMLGFLSRKRGREKSPKPQEPGILGKEGARRIIS